jgi:hypothetical protein
MASEITIKGQRAAKGANLNGSGWRLVTTKGRKRVFNATLLKVFNVKKTRLAVFRVR